jgi:site-specific DNA-methyltransferase (adenine-specific)
MSQASLALPAVEQRRGPKLTLHKGDATEWLASQEPGAIDLILTDPAYESLEKYRATGTTTRLKHSKASSNDWFPVVRNSYFSQFFVHCYRVLKRNAHLYVYCDQETAYAIKPMAEAAGFKWWNNLVWDKQKIGMGYHYRRRYEVILFFEKGKRKLSDLGVPDVITCPRVVNGYPTEKPVAVSEMLIGQSSSPGDVVADPFMGSGSVGEAALKLERRFAGNDVSDASLARAKPRLEALL